MQGAFNSYQQLIRYMPHKVNVPEFMRFGKKNCIYCKKRIREAQELALPSEIAQYIAVGRVIVPVEVVDTERAIEPLESCPERLRLAGVANAG